MRSASGEGDKVGRRDGAVEEKRWRRVHRVCGILGCCKVFKSEDAIH